MKNAFIGHVYLITELNKVFIAKNLHPKLFYMIFVTVIMNIVTISVKCKQLPCLFNEAKIRVLVNEQKNS